GSAGLYVGVTAGSWVTPGALYAGSLGGRYGLASRRSRTVWLRACRDSTSLVGRVPVLYRIEFFGGTPGPTSAGVGSGPRIMFFHGGPTPPIGGGFGCIGSNSTPGPLRPPAGRFGPTTTIPLARLPSGLYVPPLGATAVVNPNMAWSLFGLASVKS